MAKQRNNRHYWKVTNSTTSIFVVQYPILFPPPQKKKCHLLYSGNFVLKFQVILLSRITLFVLTFLFNGLMWTLFVKSMRNSSSAQAMITNSASNFISSVSEPGLLSIISTTPPPPLPVLIPSLSMLPPSFNVYPPPSFNAPPPLFQCSSPSLFQYSFPPLSMFIPLPLSILIPPSFNVYPPPSFNAHPPPPLFQCSSPSLFQCSFPLF